MFQALPDSWPVFDMREISLVADVEDLCKLWEFVERPRFIQTSWRFDIQMESGTALFTQFHTKHYSGTNVLRQVRKLQDEV
jgi:hypothetical protein